MQLGNVVYAQAPQDSVATTTRTEIFIEDVIMHRSTLDEGTVQDKKNESMMLQVIRRWWTVFWIAE